MNFNRPGQFSKAYLIPYEILDEHVMHKTPYPNPATGVIVCGAQHYEDSNMTCVTGYTAAYAAGWSAANIKTRTEVMITSVINAFNAY